MLKIFSVAALLAVASVTFAQTQPQQPGQATPGVAPSDTPAVTPSQTPAVTPSQTPAVTPSQTPYVNPSATPPAVGGPAPIGGLSKCENMIGLDKDKCLQDQRAGTGSTGTGAGTTAPQNTAPTQNTAPAGSIR
jgi:hypothetical protein